MEVIHKDPLLILEQYGLKKTNVRKLVLEVFLSVNHALSQPTVEETLGFVENRVTIYRVIKDMEAAGIIHRVVHLNGTVLLHCVRIVRFINIVMISTCTLLVPIVIKFIA